MIASSAGEWRTDEKKTKKAHTASLQCSTTAWCSAASDKYKEYWAYQHAITAAVREDFEKMHPGAEGGFAWHNEFGGYVTAGAPLHTTVTVFEFHRVVEDHAARHDRVMRKKYEELEAKVED